MNTYEEMLNRSDLDSMTYEEMTSRKDLTFSDRLAWRARYNSKRLENAEYVEAIKEAVRKQKALLDEGRSVMETFDILGDVQAELSNRFHYGFGFVCGDTVDFGLLVRD